MTLLFLGDSQEHKILQESFGRKGPSSGPQRALCGSLPDLLQVSQWPCPAGTLVQDFIPDQEAFFKEIFTIWFL